jgi:hypothetical protein
MAAKKAKTIELREGTLTVVFEGLKTMTNGPYKGEKSVGSVRVFIGEEQVGALQRFKLEALANDPLPQLDLDFGDGKMFGEKPIPPTLKTMYERTITRIREFFPWAKYVSPVGSSPVVESPPGGTEHQPK